MNVDSTNTDTTNTDSKYRFTDRVADYSLYRPGYTSETIDYIFTKTGLGANPVCADIGAAESTGLADNSADVITVAQAFHWFDLAKTRKEFTRILKPGGNIMIVWNRRDSTASEHRFCWMQL